MRFTPLQTGTNRRKPKIKATTIPSMEKWDSITRLTITSHSACVIHRAQILATPIPSQKVIRSFSKMAKKPTIYTPARKPMPTPAGGREPTDTTTVHTENGISTSMPTTYMGVTVYNNMQKIMVLRTPHQATAYAIASMPPNFLLPLHCGKASSASAQKRHLPTVTTSSSKTVFLPMLTTASNRP